MPIHEFKCEECKHIVEKIVKNGVCMIDCPKCGDYAKKIISVGSFKINGYSEANGYSGKNDRYNNIS